MIWLGRQKKFFLGMLVGILLIVGTGFFSPSPFSLLKTVEFYIRNEYITRNLDAQKLERGAIEGYIQALKDPYTRYLDPASHELLQMQVQGSVLGIGIMCRRVDNGLQITDISQDGPAKKMGLAIGDVLVEIEGVDMSSQYRFGVLPQILERDTIRLLVLRDKRRFPVVVSREKGPSLAIDSIRVIDGVGYIRIRSFEPLGVMREMEAALAQLRKSNCKALVLDLRQNTGGLLRNAVRVASLFLREGVVVITVDRYGVETPLSVDGGGRVTDWSLVILVDKRTASASEILAAALRDHGAAMIMGTPTYGKAAVQKMAVLPDGSALLYTSSRYLTPSGRDIHQKGIQVDQVIDEGLSETDILDRAVKLAKTFVRRP
jgi:carboxyl-terminal processing protease